MADRHNEEEHKQWAYQLDLYANRLENLLANSPRWPFREEIEKQISNARDAQDALKGERAMAHMIEDPLSILEDLEDAISLMEAEDID